MVGEWPAMMHHLLLCCETGVKPPIHISPPPHPLLGLAPAIDRISDLYKCADNNECAINNGNCSQICINKSPGHQCSCHNGYTLLDDGRQCVGM